MYFIVALGINKNIDVEYCVKYDVSLYNNSWILSTF